MAVSKMATWVYITKLRAASSSSAENFLYLALKFAVYADLANSSSNPYVRLENCDLFSGDRSAVSARVAATLQIRINGTGTAYSFNTGSSIQQIGILEYADSVREGGGAPYSARFSSSTNIPINKTKTEFTFNVTLTTRNSETYTRVFPACGLVPQTVSGPTALNTGAAYTYTLGTPVKNDENFEKFFFPIWLNYAEEQVNYADGHHEMFYWIQGDSFTDPYQLSYLVTTDFNTVQFAPMNYSGYQYATRNGGIVCADGYYRPPGATDSMWDVGDFVVYTVMSSAYTADKYVFPVETGSICISSVRKSVTVTNRTSVDANVRPEFSGFYHSAYAPEGSNVYRNYTNIYDQMIQRYGGIVEGARNGYYKAEFYTDETNAIRPGRVSGRAVKYGNCFLTGTLTENIGYPARTITLETGALYGGGGSSGLEETYAYCRISAFDHVGANKRLTFALKDSFGYTTTVTDTVTVLPYHRPDMPVCSARRCRVAAAGDEEIYRYNGVDYTPDENGIYALLEWQVDISALNGGNSRALKLRLSTDDAWQTISLGSYTDGGYMVVQVSGEKSYNIQFHLTDDFYSGLIFIAPLNTTYAMLDFKRGGTGVALGKVSELDFVCDIHRNWTLKMPYGTYVQNYNQNGTAVNLREWMSQVEQRMQAIINSRDISIFARWAASGSSRWTDGNTSVCVPSSYGSIMTEERLYVNYGSSTDIRTAGWMNRDAITISRRYLNISLGGVYSYAGNTATQKIVYRPTVYVLTTKPTSINQSTGAPNGTIIAQVAYHCADEPDFSGIEEYGTYALVGYYEWWRRYSAVGCIQDYSIDMSSYQNQNVWVVVTATCGYCPGLNWRMEEAFIDITELWLSNTHV